MFLRLRQGAYLVLGVGSLGGAFFALAGMLTSLVLVAAGLSKGAWGAAALGVALMLLSAAGAMGPVWILLTVLRLPDPSDRERRVLTCLLGASILAAGSVGFPMLVDAAEDAVGIATPITLFLMPMLVGLALLAELWTPILRTRGRDR